MSRADDSRDPSTVLATLFADDSREHAAVPPVDTPAYAALRERDRLRRARADAALAAHDAPTSADLYHAAKLFQHGDSAADARRAYELASESARRGHAPARWLAAASYDRWCMYEGRPQRYGTQIVPDGARTACGTSNPGRPTPNARSSTCLRSPSRSDGRRS